MFVCAALRRYSNKTSLALEPELLVCWFWAGGQEFSKSLAVHAKNWDQRGRSDAREFTDGAKLNPERPPLLPPNCHENMKSILPVEWRDGFYVSLFLKRAHTTPKPWDFVRLSGLTNCFLLFLPPCSNRSTNESRTTVIRLAVYCQVC